jgi:ABC-type branched-subunit amino acid transport system ATPase component
VTERGYVLENGKVVMENASEVLLKSEHIKRNYLGL